MYLIYLLLATMCNMYFVALQVASPASFLGTIFGFSIIWFWLGMLFIVLFFMRRFALWNYVKKQVKICLGCIVSVLAVISVVNLVFICNPRMATGNEPVKYIILLGGGITKDAKLTDNVEQRVKKCAEYAEKHPEALIVVSGGKGPFSPCPESDVLKPALAKYGIDEERILAEDKAKDTIQNFEYSVKLLSKKTGKTVLQILSEPVAVVTSDFHLARAQRLAKRMGFKDVYGVSSKTPALFVVNTYCREICCYVKLNLRILFTGKPSLIDDSEVLD